MAAALISVGGAYLLAFVGAVWYLGRELGTLKAQLSNLPTHKDVSERLRNHQDHCPAYRETTTGGPALPPARG